VSEILKPFYIHLFMEMTKLLYLDDSYLQEFDAKIIDVRLDSVVLDQTGFFYSSGGQPSDSGILIVDGKQFTVKDVMKMGGQVLHMLDSVDGLKTGDIVHGKIDWRRRYNHMRMHTAAHMLSSVMYKNGKIMITGNQLGEEHTRFDFSMEDYNPEFMKACIDEANEQIQRGADVKVYTLATEEAFKIDGILKLQGALPPNLKELRIVEICGIDIQADGGTHVKNTAEIGQIIFEKAKNKGANNRRVYFTLNPVEVSTPA
jgi:misacylated tRNA(Ala) deacylase